MIRFVKIETLTLDLEGMRRRFWSELKRKKAKVQQRVRFVHINFYRP